MSVRPVDRTARARRCRRARRSGRLSRAGALALCALAAVLPPCAPAEESQVTLVLQDGERVAGSLVKSDLDHVYIRLIDTSRNQSITAIVTYDRARIRTIEEPNPAVPEYASRRAEMLDTARAHRALARWCVDADLPQEARAEAVRAEQLGHDAETEALLLRLGMTYADGAWQDADAYLARTGRVRYAGTIMTQAEALVLQGRAEDDQAIRETIAAISDDQVLLAAEAREREALEARARQVRFDLGEASDALLRAESAVRRWHALAMPAQEDGDADADTQAAIRSAGRSAEDALPALAKRHAELQREDALVPSERSGLDAREQELRAALAVAESRLRALSDEVAALQNTRAR